MRLRTYSIIGLLLLAIGIVNYPASVSNVHASRLQTDEGPKIVSARVKGRKLILTGERFMDGAVILVDGEPQKTRNDEESPSTTLIAKKAGNFIIDYSVVSLQVQSPNGVSDKFPFFKGQVITLDVAGRPISLKVGERFLLFLLKDSYQFDAAVLDETIIRKVTDVDVPGTQGVFEALRVGNTKLNAVGELPCAKVKPACLAPAIGVEFPVIVD